MSIYIWTNDGPIPLGEGILQENGMETWLENGNYVDFEVLKVTAPTNLVGVAGTLKATLTWDSATGESGVIWTEEKLVRKEGSAPTGSMDGDVVTTITTKNTYASTGYEDTGLTAGVDYYYKVFAIYDNGTERESSAVNATPLFWEYTPTANTYGFYKLEENANDYSGMNRHGTASNITYQENSNGKKVAYFNGTNSGIELPFKNYTGSDYTRFTFLIWFNTQEIPASLSVLRNIISNQSSDYNGYFVDLQKAKIRSGIGGVLVTEDTDNISANQWYMIAITKNGNAITRYLYLTSTPKIGNQSGVYNSSNSNVNIGRRPAGDRVWKGWLSECIIENRVWTLEELNDFYSHTRLNYGHV